MERSSQLRRCFRLLSIISRACMLYSVMIVQSIDEPLCRNTPSVRVVKKEKFKYFFLSASTIQRTISSMSCGLVNDDESFVCLPSRVITENTRKYVKTLSNCLPQIHLNYDSDLSKWACLCRSKTIGCFLNFTNASRYKI